MAVMKPLNIALEVVEPETGLSKAVLNEVIEHLDTFATTGKPHVIDLTSLPMNTSDKQALEKALGHGEVQVTLTTLGESQVYETGYSGIWWIKHYTADQILLSELLEITNIPDIIKSHPEDVKQSAKEIQKILNIDHQETIHE